MNPSPAAIAAPVDSELRIRMFTAELEELMKKYKVKFTVVTVTLDGNPIINSRIQVIDDAPIMGVNMNVVQGQSGPNNQPH